MLGSRSDSEDSVKVAIGNVNTVLPVHRFVSHMEGSQTRAKVGAGTCEDLKVSGLEREVRETRRKRLTPETTNTLSTLSRFRDKQTLDSNTLHLIEGCKHVISDPITC